MNDMASKHSRSESLPKHASPVPAAWVVLLAMATASVTFQVYHSVHAGGMLPVLAVVEGVAPVAVSLGIAHVVALHKRGGTALRIAAFAVMAAGMAQSMGSIAAVIAPAAPGPLRWGFGAMLDGAALVALWVILVEHERDAERAEAAAAEARAEESAQAEVVRQREIIAGLEADLRAAQAQLEAARRTTPQRPRTAGGRRTRSAGRPAPALDPALAAIAAELADLDAGAAALVILQQQPKISGAKLAAAVGRSERWGQEFIKGQKAPSPDTGPVDRVPAD